MENRGKNKGRKERSKWCVAYNNSKEYHGPKEVTLKLKAEKSWVDAGAIRHAALIRFPLLTQFARSPRLSPPSFHPYATTLHPWLHFTFGMLGAHPPAWLPTRKAVQKICTYTQRIFSFFFVTFFSYSYSIARWWNKTVEKFALFFQLFF